jgi:hypothetical protein
MERREPLHLPVSRRTLLGAFVITPALAVLAAACGDPDAAPADTGPLNTDGAGTTVPGTDAPVSSTYVHSTDADAAVIRLGYEGGFVMPGTIFVSLPTLLVSGDGRVFRPGATTLEYPGPLVSPLGVRTITEAGVQRLLGIADTAGLLATPPNYEPVQMNIADAPDTVLTLTVDGQTYRHQAYALAMDADADGNPLPEQTPARQALADVASAFSAFEATVGAAELGEETIFAPTEYRFQATPMMAEELAGFDPAPDLVEWPAASGVTLAAASACARVAASAVGSLFTDATQNSFFTEDGVTYRVAVAAVLPGDAVC